MTRNDLVKQIAAEMQLPQTKVKRAVQLVLDGIIDTLAAEGRLELRRFGVFTVKTRRPYRARNPRTGESIMVPARKAVTFKAGRTMKAIIRRDDNGGTTD